MEAAQSSSDIQDSESNVSSDVLCTASECGGDGNNCEQSEDATTNTENNEGSPNGEQSEDVTTNTENNEGSANGD